MMRNMAYPFVMVVMCGVLMVIGCDRHETTDDPSSPSPVPSDETTPTSEADEADEAEAGEAAALPDALPVADLAALESIVDETAARGQVLVIDFWATWCVPCVAMFPDLHGGLKQMGDAVRPVSVTLDEPGAYEQQAIRFLAEHDAVDDAYMLVSTSEGQVAVVDGLGERWTDLVVPAILVFDSQGRLAGEFIDANARTDRILARVRELVEAGGDAESDSEAGTQAAAE